MSKDIMSGINRFTLVENSGDKRQFKILSGNSNLARCDLATTDIFGATPGRISGDIQCQTAFSSGEVTKQSAKIFKKDQFVSIPGNLSHRRYDTKSCVTWYFTQAQANTFKTLHKPAL
ncbi:MAG: hypothetical protein EOP48_03135 [Sphingobacteriales bacterium]|nr:MAG: hypothetical protein EOP48_03135 [Sphingobacteriales bacterium]